jgi:hypothetical protein
MADSILSLVFRVAAHPEHADHALAAEREAVMNLGTALVGTRTALQQYGKDLDVASQSSARFADAMGKDIARAAVYGSSIGQAMERALKATVESIAAKALVQAIYSTALGFLLLAEFDFPAAAQAFEAAAIFGAVGGAAAAVGAAIPGGGRRGLAGRDGAGGRYGRGAHGGEYGGEGDEQWTYGAMSSMGMGLAPGAQPAAQPSGALTVAIMGDADAGQWLATTLNRAVSQQGVQLVSTSSQRGAPVGH